MNHGAAPFATVQFGAQRRRTHQLGRYAVYTSPMSVVEISWMVEQARRASKSQTIIHVDASGKTSSCLSGTLQAKAIRIHVVDRAIFRAGAAAHFDNGQSSPCSVRAADAAVQAAPPRHMSDIMRSGPRVRHAFATMSVA